MSAVFKKDHVITFFSTLLATLIGVLVAVGVSEVQKENREKEDVVKILDNTQAVLNSFMLGIVNLKRDYDSQIRKKDSHIKLYKESNPIVYPDFLENVFQHPMIKKHVSNYTQVVFFQSFFDLKRMKRYDMLSIYIVILKNIENLLALEIDYIEEKLSSIEQVDEMAAEYYLDELKKINDARINVVVDTIRGNGPRISDITIQVEMLKNK